MSETPVFEALIRARQDFLAKIGRRPAEVRVHPSTKERLAIEATAQGEWRLAEWDRFMGMRFVEDEAMDRGMVEVRSETEITGMSSLPAGDGRTA